VTLAHLNEAHLNEGHRHFVCRIIHEETSVGATHASPCSVDQDQGEACLARTIKIKIIEKK
jgi:hypothetical protein